MASLQHFICLALIILAIGISSSTCNSGSGSNTPKDKNGNSSLTIYPLSTTYITLSLLPSVMITPTKAVDDGNDSGLSSEVATGIIIGILLIVLFLLVCIIALAWYIIRARKKYTQLMEVSYSYSYHNL